MEHYLSLFVRAIFIENMALAFFLACAPSLQYRKKLLLQRVWVWR